LQAEQLGTDLHGDAGTQPAKQVPSAVHAFAPGPQKTEG
jgi:hypothetical protein